MTHDIKKWKQFLSEGFGPSEGSRDPEFMFKTIWLGEFTDTDNTNARFIREICMQILSEAGDDEAALRRVKNLFEQHAGGLMRDLERFAYSELGLEDPLDNQDRLI